MSETAPAIEASPPQRSVRSRGAVIVIGQRCTGWAGAVPVDAPDMSTAMQAAPHARRTASKVLGLACLVLGSAPLHAFAEEASFKELKGAQITTVLRGKYVSDDHHWGHHYLADGRVMLHESRRDSPGQWSVRHDQLCLLKPQISNTEPICYTVQRQADQLRYVDDMKRVVYQGYVRGRADARLFDNHANH